MTSNTIFNLNIRIGKNQCVKISIELLATSCNRDKFLFSVISNLLSLINQNAAKSCLSKSKNSIMLSPYLSDDQLDSLSILNIKHNSSSCN